jgi:c-di-GMP-binding flagellar brake protein YcgR
VLSGPQGHAVRASLWTVDLPKRRIAFDVEAGNPGLEPLVGGNECTATAYLQRVRLQFDLSDLMLVRGPRGTALQCALPEAIYRFQRRQAFRVEPIHRTSATAVMRHPSIPEMTLSLRVMDISAGGCALQLPPDVPPMPLGIVLDGVVMHLDPETSIVVCLRLQHATSVGQQADGVRLGCEFVAVDPEAQRRLQMHVDQIQRRRRLLAVE